ncbi:glycosyltransferase [Nonomuraea sp. MCN248]|uniref:Glycosyltransferase n=1 Tax=Nonomuraea corallina TaxID=2989783 RepID=A0ABT4SBT8_9ACTN|nr:glycosyltransferase [Nonomuraea corallina]MDA0634406.1 glycosyltransferase [Nonomuraea corallina]
MRVVIIGVGTYGDVAPYTGLGARLREAGHEVTIAAHEPYAKLVTEGGLEHLPLPGDPLTALTGSLSISAFKEYGEQLVEGLAGIAERDADLLLLGVAGAPGLHVAEAMGVPSMGVHLQPIEPTGDFPPVLSLFQRSLGRWGNRRAARLAFESPVAGPVLVGLSTKMRAGLGLPPTTPRTLYRRRESMRWPVFHGVSPLVVPRPADWRPGLEITGYWWPLRPRGWQPDPVLRDFLASGPAPAFVGFGSLAGARAEEYTELAVRALRRAGLRGVLQTGLRGRMSDDVLGVGDVPHDWLFPRVTAVAHHCGGGTTGAGVRAGVPAVAVPVMNDQPFWASRLMALGVAPAAIPFRRLTPARLAAALSAAVTDPAYRQRAQALSARVSAEDGAAPVVEAVNRL